MSSAKGSVLTFTVPDPELLTAECSYFRILRGSSLMALTCSNLECHIALNIISRCDILHERSICESVHSRYPANSNYLRRP
jgi:hypothetical protein